MKKNYLFITFIVLCCTFFLCCERDTDPIIIVTSDNFISPMQTDMHVRFNIEAKSKKSFITRIEIKEYSSDYGYRTLKDTLIDEKEAFFFFEYTVPIFTKNQEVKLIFTAYNEKKEKSISNLRYDYVFEDELLTEYGTFSMFTLKSGKEDGFSIDAKKVIYTIIDTADFYSYVDTLNIDELQRTWRSFTGLDFVKFKGFDYPKATRKSLTDSYLSGVEQPTVTNIETGDIILIGFGKIPKGAIKVIGVYDEEGYKMDRYEFSAKFIEYK